MYLFSFRLLLERGFNPTEEGETTKFIRTNAIPFNRKLLREKRMKILLQVNTRQLSVPGPATVLFQEQREDDEEFRLYRHFVRTRQPPPAGEIDLKKWTERAHLKAGRIILNRVSVTFYNLPAGW